MLNFLKFDKNYENGIDKSTLLIYNISDIDILGFVMIDFSLLRKNKGYTQSTLAKALGLTQGTVAMWESGKSVPNMKHLLRLEALLGINASGLCASFPKNRMVKSGGWGQNDKIQNV